MKAEYTLPPNVYNYCSANKVTVTGNNTNSHIEIEVSRINFITDKSIKAPTSVSLYESPGQTKASSLYQHGAGVLGVFGAVTAKIIWWGEQQQQSKAAASVSISCDACSSSIKKLCADIKHKIQRQGKSQQLKKKKQKQHRHNYHNKLRYCVRSQSLALFLEYLRECPSIDVKDHAHDQESPSPPTAAVEAASEGGGAAVRLPLPAPLLRKYAANNVNGCNFEYKTKIYALYRHVESRGTSGQVQQQQQLRVGGIQLRSFKMLFAAAAASASANKAVRVGAATVPPPLPLPPPTALSAALLQQDHQLTINNCSKTQPGERISGTVKSAVASAVAMPAKVELMEAMKKLDADLVALFATAAEPSMDQLKKQQQHLNKVEQLWPEQELPEQELPTSSGPQDQATPELFKQVNALQLHMEALTLQAEGTKRMELLQSEVRPIFTVECQLSDELINAVPPGPMFHIMQFESEKFQSLTQCTRFGQTQQRQVHLPAVDNEKEMGSIHFTIWWREPGTCLNEMLGMGRLPLAELYQASLLEQCKCIAIQRRDLHLASLYLKISLRSDQQMMVANGRQAPIENNNNNNSNNNKNNKNNHSAAAAANNNNLSGNSDSKSAATSPLAANNNNKASLDIVNFMAETTKVRLLRGYIFAGETRQLSPSDASSCTELVLQPFWQSQPLSVTVNQQGAFQLQEQFAIINDEKFLHSVERQQLLLELRPLGGQVHLPLHQFYIAYRDATITNHLCKGKLPVISIDGWTPIVHPETQAQLGELKVLLAIGSESQIAQLKQLRGFDMDNNQQQPLRRTTDLLDMLQNALSAPAAAGPASVAIAPNSGSQFSFSLEIVGAAGLPLNPGYGKCGKKQAKRQAAAKRFPPNEPPNTYVTFQALSCNALTYKSHEGLVYATPIVEHSTTPQWHSKFQVAVAGDYLSNPQKLFILKVWKKTALGAGTSTQPTPLEDAIIGFAALNLNRSSGGGGGGFPTGWHNIVDFNGRVTGGLEVNVQPLPGAVAGTVDNAIDQFEQSLELRHLQLGQAIKRKFTELEQISNRLRTRLVDVTGETLQSPQYDVDAALDKWQPDELQQWHEDDELVADFERALRTPTPPPQLVASSEEASSTPTAQNQADAGKE